MLCSYPITTQLLRENKSKEKLLAPETRNLQELCCTIQPHNAVFLRHSNVLYPFQVLSNTLNNIYALFNIPNLSKQSHWPLSYTQYY